MIFGIIKCDDKVFTGDKLRIDLSESFLTPDQVYAVVSHEVSLDAGATWFNISNKKTIDWLFSSAGTKTITARISTTAPDVQTFTKTITVLDLTAQKLFSSDSELYKYEPEIDQYLPKRWSSWNLVHLKAQEYIMDWLDEKRLFNQDGEKYVVADLLDKDQVKQFATYKALEFIFEANSNVADDLYAQKRNKYLALANEKAAKSQISLDYNKNGIADERTDLLTVGLYRG